LSVRLKSSGTAIKDLVRSIQQVHDQAKGVDIWLSEYLSELLSTKSVTLFNCQLYL